MWALSSPFLQSMFPTSARGDQGRAPVGNRARVGTPGGRLPWVTCNQGVTKTGRTGHACVGHDDPDPCCVPAAGARVRHSGLCSCLRGCAAARAGVRICAELNFGVCLATARLCRDNFRMTQLELEGLSMAEVADVLEPTEGRSPADASRQRRARCRPTYPSTCGGRGALGRTRASSTRRSRQQHAGAGPVWSSTALLDHLIRPL